MPAFKLILLTGATGYIGGRLLPLLAADAWRVRCLARQPENLLPRVPDAVEVLRGRCEAHHLSVRSGRGGSGVVRTSSQPA
jgi:uncharacterized protein YbjT (DUF2867 family)